MDDLDRLRRVRAGLPVGMAGAGDAGVDAALPDQRDRRQSDRGAGVALQGRAVSRVSATHQCIHSAAQKKVEVMTATVITPRPADPAISLPFRLLAKNLLPDSLVRFGIRRLLAERLREEKRTTEEAQQRHLMRFIAQLKASPIAINTREANEQHYELPCEFFEMVMGKHMKYSSCYFQPGVTSLDDAEAEMLAL